MKNILIVEDSSTVRKLVAFLLKGDDISISEAEDGEEGLILAKEKNFDLLISDYNMPNMNGLELVTALRTMEHYQNLPILMLTTESDPELKEQGKALGLTGWIIKPLNPEIFKKVVGKVLKKANA